jgi:hypothetical protein
VYVYLRGAIDGGDEGMCEMTMLESFCTEFCPADRDDDAFVVGVGSSLLVVSSGVGSRGAAEPDAFLGETLNRVLGTVNLSDFGRG